MEVVWYTAMSMDGRIADADDDLSFLESIGERDAAGGGEFGTFLESVDAVVVGAGTMRWLLRGGHGWPHDDLPTWLVSHDGRLLEQIGKTRSPLRLADGDLGQMFADIEEAGHRRVWLAGGGDIAGQALAADRIDEVLATVAPTVLGAGPALFDGQALPRRRFRLAECTSAGGDAALLRWVREAA
jgi:riboflavin biosynthesis pyrimidine reductase